MKRYRRWLVVLGAMLLAAFGRAILVQPVLAHSLFPCPNGQPAKWVGSVHTYYTPNVAGYTQEIHDAASNMSGNTDFDWPFDWRYWAAESSWAIDYYGDVGWAGRYYLSVYCTGTSSEIRAASFNLNRTHLDSDSAGQRQCTAIHEFGHGVGLADTDQSITSIMEIPHEQRCHSWLIETVQSHDISDINSLY